jgi:hypothetical protein
MQAASEPARLSSRTAPKRRSIASCLPSLCTWLHGQDRVGQDGIDVITFLRGRPDRALLPRFRQKPFVSDTRFSAPARPDVGDSSEEVGRKSAYGSNTELLPRAAFLTGTAQQALGRERTANLRNAMEAIRRRLDDADTAGALAGQNRARRDQVGSGRRRDKRRTYRFQDDCVTDSITGQIARCRDVLRGDFDELWAR